MAKVLSIGLALLSIIVFDTFAGEGRAAACDVINSPIPSQAKITVLAEGDSITFGDGATDGSGSYVARSDLSSDPQVRLLNHSKTGAILGVPSDTAPGNSLYARLQSDNAVLTAKVPGSYFIISILIGRNDLVNYGQVGTYLQNLGRYIKTLKAAGWDRVVLGTLLPSNWAPFKTWRSEWNATVLADCWASKNDVDAIARFGEMPEMGSDEAAAAHVFYADGTHPRNRGYEAMAVVYTEAIDSLRESK